MTKITNNALNTNDSKTPNLPANPTEHALSLKEELNSQSSLDNFGTDLQNQLDSAGRSIMDALNQRDTNSISTHLNELVVKIKDDKQMTKQSDNILGKVFRKTKHYAYKMQAQAQTLGANIDTIADALEEDSKSLQTDNDMLTNLLEDSRTYYQRAQDYIDAGNLKLNELDTKTLPGLIDKTHANPTDALLAQELQQARAFRHRLSKRVYNLQLTQQTVYQQGAQIQMIQASNKALIDNINESITNTIPLWRSQVAMRIALIRQEEAVRMQADVHKLTNRLLTENAKQMHDSSITIAQQNVQGVVDEKVLENSWQSLVDQVKTIKQIQLDADKTQNEASKRLIAIQDKYQKQLTDLAKN